MLKQAIGFLLLGLGLAISNVGGTGGGSISIPLLVLLFGIPPYQAIPFGNVAVLGTSLASVFLTLQKRHPILPSRLLVDWDIVAMMEPATMLGTLLGTFLHHSLPQRLIIALLIATLSVMALRMFYRGCGDYCGGNRIPLRALESLEVQEQELQHFYHSWKHSSSCDLSESLEDYNGASRGEYGSLPTARQREGNETSDSATTAIKEEVPWRTVGVICGLFSGICVLNAVKRVTQPILGRQTIAPWALQAGMVCYIAAIGCHLRERVLDKWRKRHATHYQPMVGEIAWDSRNSLSYPAMCSLAGVIAGTFGIGGGIISTPLMIELGVHPFVASSTSTVMIFFTAIVASSSYAADGSLQLSHWQFPLALFTLGVFATAFSQLVLVPALHQSPHMGLLPILLGTLILLSATLIAVQQLLINTAAS